MISIRVCRCAEVSQCCSLVVNKDWMMKGKKASKHVVSFESRVQNVVEVSLKPSKSASIACVVLNCIKKDLLFSKCACASVINIDL